MHDMELKLQGVLELSFPFYKHTHTPHTHTTHPHTHKKKKPVKFRCLELFGKILNFHPFFVKNPNFRLRTWHIRHNFVTLLPILVIKVSMVRGDQYLSIDIKTKFIETLVAKIQGERLQQIRWLDEGYWSRQNSLWILNRLGFVAVLKYI